ncbi:unnamed protein product [Pleuronectes platessa]|uniref:PARP n=1 Tax=Pleuronectes platessa TaxID=8262 RepID=A0A9N7UR56_PLEPL|nr:unnamed protein product [Pleuronectes platessa]
MYVLRGLKEDVLSTTELIKDALSKDRQDEKEAMTAYHVQWLIQDAEEVWQELSLHENFLQEDALLNKRASAEVTARDATVLRVNLSALEATNWQTGQRFKIERVQNLYLWQAFSVCRQRIFCKNSRDEEQLGERSLYHGTSAESCDCIEKDRFDRNYAGKHDPTDCFDSLVDNQQSPTMFVVFHDDQAYPEYLITFRNVEAV